MDIKQKDFYYQRSSVWKKFQEVGLKHAVHLHDIFETVLSLGDVISDIVIIYGWYQIPSAVNYSYAGMVILALSQCVYTWLILLHFDCPQAPLYAKRIGLIIVGLLFGQLYPTVLLLKSRGYLAAMRTYVPGGEYLYRTIVFQPETCALPADKTTWTVKHYCLDTMFAHLGFVIEGFVEALPQVCIQIAFLVSHPHSQLNYLSTISMMLSLMAFLSKIVMFAGQIELRHWPTTLLIPTLVAMDVTNMLLCAALCYGLDTGHMALSTLYFQVGWSVLYVILGLLVILLHAIAATSLMQVYMNWNQERSFWMNLINGRTDIVPSFLCGSVLLLCTLIPVPVLFLNVRYTFCIPLLLTILAIQHNAADGVVFIRNTCTAVDSLTILDRQRLVNLSGVLKVFISDITEIDRAILAHARIEHIPNFAPDDLNTADQLFRNQALQLRTRFAALAPLWALCDPAIADQLRAAAVHIRGNIDPYGQPLDPDTRLAGKLTSFAEAADLGAFSVSNVASLSTVEYELGFIARVKVGMQDIYHLFTRPAHHHISPEFRNVMGRTLSTLVVRAYVVIVICVGLYSAIVFVFTVTFPVLCMLNYPATPVTRSLFLLWILLACTALGLASSVRTFYMEFGQMATNLEIPVTELEQIAALSGSTSELRSLLYTHTPLPDTLLDMTMEYVGNLRDKTYFTLYKEYYRPYRPEDAKRCKAQLAEKWRPAQEIVTWILQACKSQNIKQRRQQLSTTVFQVHPHRNSERF